MPPTWRGVRPAALSSPMSRCCSLARALTRIATTATTTMPSSTLKAVSTTVVAWVSATAVSRMCCQVWRITPPEQVSSEQRVRWSAGRDASVASANAGAADGSSRRIACVQFQPPGSGAMRCSVARVVQAVPGWESG